MKLMKFTIARIDDNLFVITDSDSKSKKKRKRSDKSLRPPSPFSKYMAVYGGRESEVPLLGGPGFAAGSSTAGDGQVNDYDLRVSSDRIR